MSTTATGVPAATLSNDEFYTDPSTGEIVTAKFCAHCHLLKPLIAFHHKTKGKYGRQEWCKRCANKKPPMTWEAEQAHLLGTTSSGSREDASTVNAAKSSAATQDAAADAEDVATGATIITTLDDFLNAVDDAIANETDETTETDETEREDYVMTGNVTAEKMGEVEFADWFKSDSPVFSNALVTVMRFEGSFAIYTNAAIRVPNYVPTGVISDTRYLELIVRTLSDNVGRAPAVYGFSYQ